MLLLCVNCAVRVMHQITYENGNIVIGKDIISTDDHYLAFEELLSYRNLFYIEQSRQNTIQIKGYQWPCEGDYYAFYESMPSKDNGCFFTAANSMFWFLENKIPFTMTVEHKKKEDMRLYPWVTGREPKKRK